MNYYIPSTWRRLMAKGVDSVIRFVFYLPYAKPFFLLFFSDEKVTLSLMSFFIIFITPAVYEFIFLVTMQATPGKWLMGLKVVPFYDVSAKLDWRQCVLRPLVERLSFYFSLAIYATAFFRYDRTHAADWVAETRVIQFSPRPIAPRIRWFMGTILIVLNLIEGLQSASRILSVINWGSNKVELREILNAQAAEGEIDVEGE